MRFFASSHQLHQLAPRTLLLTFLFLVGVCAQGVSGILLHHHGAGWTASSIAAYYRGSAPVAPVDDAALDAHFAIGDPPPPAAAPVTVARSFGTLLEVAHFHLVAMPLLLLVVAHLFSMAPWGRSRWAGAVCYFGFACAFVDILAPFAVRYLSADFAPVKLVAFIGLEAVLIGMAATCAVCCLVAWSRLTPPAPPVR
jgi:hypothetical protein